MDTSQREAAATGGTEMITEAINIRDAELIARLIVECGIYKKALEEIYYSSSPDDQAFQVALDALHNAREHLKRHGVRVAS